MNTKDKLKATKTLKTTTIDLITLRHNQILSDG